MQLELDMARNMFGDHLTEDCKNRLLALLKNPTVKTWDKAFSIILNDQGMTLWQAIIAIDPTFPRTGRSRDLEGNLLREWEQIPNKKLVEKALRFATH